MVNKKSMRRIEGIRLLRKPNGFARLVTVPIKLKARRVRIRW